MIASEKQSKLSNKIIETAFLELENQRQIVAKEKRLIRHDSESPDYL